MHKSQLDISILERKPEPTVGVIAGILPLAPLSMVSDLPGSYYKTLKSPNKKMLCGLFESILGWQISLADRAEILQRLRAIRHKQSIEYASASRGSTYLPLLFEYFDIQLPVVPVSQHYDDYWSRAFRRADAVVHPKGTINIDASLIAEKRKLKRNANNLAQVDDKALEKFFLRYKHHFPLYYSTPTRREYIVLNEEYKIKLLMDEGLVERLSTSLTENNLGYLGNSEGWVHLRLARS